MDRIPRVAVVLALVVGLLATGPTAGIGVVDPAGTDEGTAPAPDPATGPDPATEDPEGMADPATGADGTRGAAGGPDAGEPTDPDAVPVDPPRAGPIPNETPDRLGLGQGRIESGIARPTPDLAASLSAGDGEFKSVYVAYLARERLAEAESDERRLKIVGEILALVEDRVESLRRREATAVAAYHNGSIDERELLRRLGRIDAEAGALRKALNDVEERNADVITTPSSFRFTTLDLDLESLEGPVRDRVGRALRGDAEPFRVRVTASAQGVALETVDDGDYTREAVRLDHYAPTENPAFGTSGALDRLKSRYPHTFERTPDSLNSVGSRLFQIAWSYSQGATTVYFDRATGEVYRETQQLRLSRIPNATVSVAAREEYRLVVSRADGIDGLYGVRVYNATSGDGRDVAVALDGETIGRTGDDGVLWTLREERSFNVTTTVEGIEFNVSVSG